MKIQDNASAVINEYGSNMINSKFDPLTDAEAKRALKAGNNYVVDDILGFQEENTKQKEVDSVAVAGDEVSASPPKPIVGTQDVLANYMSSQEGISGTDIDAGSQAYSQGDSQNGMGYSDWETVVDVEKNGTNTQSDDDKGDRQVNAKEECPMGEAKLENPTRQSSRLKK